MLPVQDATLDLTWKQCEKGHWCRLEYVDLDGPYFKNKDIRGVYIIWRSTEHPNVVYVGQGSIANRLMAHRHDTRIMGHGSHSVLYVTWAEVPDDKMDGVERFLVDIFNPIAVDRAPDAQPITVNLPA